MTATQEQGDLRQFFGAEVSSSHPLNRSQLTVFGDGKERITVHDPARSEGQRERSGQFFVKLPDRLAKILPGSYLLPREFLKEIGLRMMLNGQRKNF